MKVAFFDRDGTIIKDYPDDEWTYTELPIFFEESFSTLRKVKELGFEIIIITNQYLIEEGFITQLQYEEFTSVFLQKLYDEDIQVLDIFYCPHSRDSGCNCCKPRTGLIEQALEKYPTINLDKSFFVGDSLADVQVARAMKLPMFWIEEKKTYTKDPLVLHIKNIQEILPFLEEEVIE